MHEFSPPAGWHIFCFKQYVTRMPRHVHSIPSTSEIHQRLPVVKPINEDSVMSILHSATMQPVLHSFEYCLDFLREQVADVSPSDMVAQPAPIKNHPAWVIGHLTWTCQLLGGAIGMAAWLPENWAQRYGTGSQPAADPDLYESKTDALAILDDARDRIRDRIQKLDDALLDQEFPDESYRQVFPTIRHALTQVLVAHTANHIGQITIWRRAMGLPSLGRSFE